MNEARKNHQRRFNNGDYNRFGIFEGKGIDIGCGKDPITPYCECYDREQGDAQFMAGVPDESFDWVHSSHCLEHLEKPEVAIQHWWRILKPGGHLIVTVPDFALYEKFHMPSRFNAEHKHGFTIPSLVLLALPLKRGQILRLQVNDDGFNYDDHESDQTRAGAQAEIELIVRKHRDSFWTGDRK